jgi:EAL domain-containing protein (putative c-di-GMP-specific phosphodiesterase class I)
MLRNADTAMYSAKADGRGLCVLYEPSMHEAVLNRRALETDLRNAIAAGELTIAYQPEVDIRSGRIVGMEALSRWRHPIRGPLAPDVFIPLAEEAGLIDELDDLVLRSVTAQGRKWQLQGLGPIRLAVNVSARELSDSALLDRVTRALTDSGLDSSWLELEVTESAAANSAAAVEVLGRLSDLGVQIAIDDFGVGYSMLSRLQDFPLAKLKIDRAFIHEIQAATDRAPLVQGIIAMGHSLGLEIVAEGVELAAQLEFLEAHGCDQVQGYLIGRPAEASEAERLLQLSVVLDPARERARATPDPVISIAYSARSRRS